MPSTHHPALEESLFANAAADLDRALVDRRDLDSWSDAWIAPAERWSKAVWDRAVELGPLPVASEDLAAGRCVANAPVYVCGAPRSGTTLVRDLLDGHPALSVLPAEGKFFEQFSEPSPDTSSARGVHAQRWLKLLANPNHQRPFWLLGPCDSEAGAYASFARAFLTWNEALADQGLAFRLQPAAALSLAVAAGQDVLRLRRSVDKSPGYEFHAAAIWAHHPDAKLIHLVRHPAAIAASYSTGLARAKLNSTPVSRMLRNVVSSLIAGWRAAHLAPLNHLFVRYEDLVADRRKEMARIASFLDVEWDDCLLRQTILGLPAEPNTSFHGIARRQFRPKNAKEWSWLAVASTCHALLAKGPATGASAPAQSPS